MAKNENEPAMNLITAPFLYMLNNDYLEVSGNKSTEQVMDILEGLSSRRMKMVAESIDLFDKRNIISLVGSVKDKLKVGSLYSVPIIEHQIEAETFEVTNGYTNRLFLDITRDGMRLVIPIYKLYTLDTNITELQFVPVDFDKTVFLKVQDRDQFLISEGDTLRGCLRQLRKQSLLNQRAQLEHAGISGEFDEDQI